MPRTVALIRRLRPESWLAVTAGALLLLLGVQLVRYAWLKKVRTRLGTQLERTAANPQREGVPDVEGYKAIAQKGHFGKAPRPKLQLFGILAESAILGTSPQDAKLYAVEAKLPGDCKLLEILPNSVVIEADGKKESLTLFPPFSEATPPQPPKADGPAAPAEAEKPGGTGGTVPRSGAAEESVPAGTKPEPAQHPTTPSGARASGLSPGTDARPAGDP